MRKIYLLLLGLFSLISAVSTGQTTVTFNVNNGMLPISNATVVVDGDTATYDMGLQEHSIGLGNGTYTYTVSAPGYLDATGEITVPNNDVNNYYFVSLSLPTTVTFNVNNGMLPISTATVMIDGQTAAYDAGLTEYSIVLADGIYSYTVTAPDYAEVTGTITVPDAGINNYHFVTMTQAYSLRFVVSDNVSTIQNAQVTIDTTSYLTDINGEVVYDGLAAGTYNYTINADNHNEMQGSVEIVDMDVIETVNLIITGIDDISNSSLSVYPNPTSDFVNIQLSNCQDCQVDIKLVAVTGKIIKHISSANGFGDVIRMNMMELQSGIYFLQIKESDSYRTHKILKK